MQVWLRSRKDLLLDREEIEPLAVILHALSHNHGVTGSADGPITVADLKAVLWNIRKIDEAAVTYNANSARSVTINLKLECI